VSAKLESEFDVKFGRLRFIVLFRDPGTGLGYLDGETDEFLN
jgi:hypothetical protein